ncbi:NADPH dehydrogenase [mine drainage metagenome]|uniref:NADPH dehydrogenase n=1 Tax=mine drainage metagenome TaxID=410659 RepID=A0A1J5RJJ7_9ZZZZ
MSSKLFTPIQLGGITLANRIVIAPMCQYSADDGCIGDWHAMHLPNLVLSGAGLLVIEATGVTREARISHGCVGLYSDHNEAALARVLAVCRRISNMPIGIQLAHAGRKASAQVHWAGGGALPATESPWPTQAPSAIPFADDWHTPQALDLSGMRRIVDAFAAAAARTVRLGLDAVELHAAHGYLLHQFMSPLSNRRSDAYGGSLENRLRFPLEVAAALREVLPRDKCLGARITASDWMEGGAGPEVAVALARELKRIGYDYVCVTSGGLVPAAKIIAGPGYQVPFAAQVKRESGIATRAVGMIADPAQAEAVIASGQADMVALARAFLDDPRWGWHAAERLGAKVDYPPQYLRSRPDLWPGSKLARRQ